MFDTEVMELVNEQVEEKANNLRNEYPGFTDEQIKNLARMQTGVEIAIPDSSEDGINNMLAVALQIEVDAGMGWAVSVLGEFKYKKYRESYDKAVANKVSPLPVLRADHGLTMKEAKEVAAHFKKEQDILSSSEEEQSPNETEGPSSPTSTESSLDEDDEGVEGGRVVAA